VKGFSYIEVIFTIAIMALIATAAVPYVEVIVVRNKESQLRQNLREIRIAIDKYKKASDDGRIAKLLNETGYPRYLEELVDGVEDITDSKKAKIFFLRRIPRDPFFKDAAVPAAQTWALRSYDSSFEFPQPGKDIFDVYSSSHQKGLNGIPYNEW
jgi:general secretion pathway protein G